MQGSITMGQPAHFVAPWDLDRDLACLPQSPDDGTVVLVESVAKGSALPYHRKKLVFVLSAMHHFADALRADGFDVEVRRSQTYVDGIAEHVAERGSTRVIAMEPREWGLARALDRAQAADTFGVPVDRHDDGGPGGHFLPLRWCGTRGFSRTRITCVRRLLRPRLSAPSAPSLRKRDC